MENLNAEQVKKGLECFHQRILDTHLADDIRDGEMMAILDAIALIKELTEENERLKLEYAGVEAGAKQLIEKLRKSNAVLIEDNHILATEFKNKVKVDTVRKMQERLKAKAVGFPNYIGEVIAARWVDRIAEEMLEVAQRPEVLNDQSSGLSDPEGDRAESRKNERQTDA